MITLSTTEKYLLFTEYQNSYTEEEKDIIINELVKEHRVNQNRN